MYGEKINAYLDTLEHWAELVEAISRLVRIRSMWEKPLPGMPFDPGPVAALAEGLKLTEELGFTTCDYDNYVGTADLSDKKTTLHILYHLDAVGGGTGQTMTESCTPKEVDGMLYGRGTDDDKSPVATVLPAMKAMKELGVPLRHNTHLLTGTDKESSSNDIVYYCTRKPCASYASSPGVEFPLINTEKDNYKPVFTKSWLVETTTPRMTEFHGGFRTNVLPPEAECLVTGLSADAAYSYYDRAAAKTGVCYKLYEEGNSLRILCHSGGTHASLLGEDISAITDLLRLFYSFPLAKVGPIAVLRALGALFPHGGCAGKVLGIVQSDEPFGVLILAFSLLTVNGTGLEGQLDSRIPICANDEDYRTAAEAPSSEFGFSTSGKTDTPHHTPADSPLAKVLLRCYEQYIDCKGEYLTVGGDTYVHDIPGNVAPGCCIPSFNDNMHGANEHTCIADQLTATKIFTQAIIDLCG